MHTRKNFLPQSRHSFICVACGEANRDDQASPRNHCRSCLSSLHVDQTLPGDRQSPCGGVMRPIGFLQRQGKEQVVQECLVCHVQNRNKIQPDDNRDILYHIMQAEQQAFLLGKKQII